VTSFYGRDATMLPRRSYWRRLYKRLFLEGDLFLAEGPHMAETLVRIGCPPAKVRVVHLGVDLSGIDFKERHPGPSGEAIGLIAASFREKKGIVYGLDAVARVAGRWPALRIRIIGDGPLRPQIERRISRPDLAGRVELLGYLDYPSYLNEIDAAHFLLAPSVTASDGDCEGGAPVCILDAQAAGLPVLATTHCDIPEVTDPGRSALLSPERDVESLATDLERLLQDPDLWPEMGRAGRAHVEAGFDILKQAEKMATIYEELIGPLEGS
jgi:colanic acid/amylovoran biosynthesis glycosyltransferase